MIDQPGDPRYPPRAEQDRNGAIDTVAKAAVFFVCTLIVVFVLYAMNQDDQTAATTSAPTPATTTGQSQAPAPEPKAASKAEPKAEGNGEPKSEPKAEQKAEPSAK